MRKLLFLPLLALCLVFTAMVPKPAEANPAFLFAFTAITGGWAAATYEECKTDGIDAKACAKRTWDERTDVPITQELYKQNYND